MNFTSDNASGASAQVLAAIMAANDGSATPYGVDSFTARAETALANVFEHEISMFLVPTGTAANSLALAALTPPWGAVFCHQDAHVVGDECGAPEFFIGGGKLVGLPGALGKISPATLADALRRYPRGVVKQAQPASLTLTQATESGTLYTPAEIAALAGLAHEAGLGVHMDGARFANAVVALGRTPAEISWKAGVDVLSFGATKNGTFCCEAVVFFDRARAADFAFRRKRGGHTLSKGRLLGAQMLAYLDRGHWLDLAAHANALAQRLAAGLAATPGARLAWACEANEVFTILPRSMDAALQAAGARYYDWNGRGLEAPNRLGSNEVLARLVTSFATSEAEVDQFIAVARGASGPKAVSTSP